MPEPAAPAARPADAVVTRRVGLLRRPRPRGAARHRPPARAPTELRLPVCVGLHGLRGNALWWSDPGNRASARRRLGARGAAVRAGRRRRRRQLLAPLPSPATTPCACCSRSSPAGCGSAGLATAARPATCPASRRWSGHLDGRGGRAASTPASAMRLRPPGACGRRRSARACSPTGASPSRRPFAGRGRLGGQRPAALLPRARRRAHRRVVRRPRPVRRRHPPLHRARPARGRRGQPRAPRRRLLRARAAGHGRRSSAATPADRVASARPPAGAG